MRIPIIKYKICIYDLILITQHYIRFRCKMLEVSGNWTIRFRSRSGQFPPISWGKFPPDIRHLGNPVPVQQFVTCSDQSYCMYKANMIEFLI